MDSQKEIKKPSKYKKNNEFSDGSKVKKKYFFDDDKNYIIYLDTQNEVRYKTNSDFDANAKIRNLPTIVAEISEIWSFFKKDLNLRLAHIYRLGLLNNFDVADEEVGKLIKIIDSRKRIIKKICYLMIPLISIITFCFYSIIFNKEIAKIICFSSMGCFLSVSTTLKDIEFDTEETVTSYSIFSFFKLATSIFSSILLIRLYKCNLLNKELMAVFGEGIIFILAALGGFSSKLVPDIFKKYEQKISSD